MAHHAHSWVAGPAAFSPGVGGPLGGLLVILSVCLRVAIGRRLTSHGPAYEAQLREKLGLPPAGGGAVT